MVPSAPVLEIFVLRHNFLTMGIPFSSFSGLRGRLHPAAGAPLLFISLLGACEPTVRVEPPREPITINLNVKVDADVRVKLERQAEDDIRNNNDIF